MKIIMYTTICLLVMSINGLCDTIQIESIDPMPGFESVGGPAFGEPVESFSGKGLVQYISESKIMINSKMYFIDSSCLPLIVSNRISRACIVAYELNKQARIKQLDVIARLAVIGTINRINSNELVINDHFYKFGIYATYHNVFGNQISQYDINKGDFVGLIFNKDSDIRSLWHLNGFYMY